MNKLEALQKTIYNLENGIYKYSWTDFKSCNCGILARTILGGKDIAEAGFHNSPVVKYSENAFSQNAFCMTTNFPLPEVFQALKDTGFSFAEISDLEILGNKKIVENLKWDKGHCNYTSKSSVILYLKEWIKMLQQTAPEPDAKFVTYSKIIEAIPVNAN